jgi:hypothetical protein
LQSIRDDTKLAVTKKGESKGKKGWRVVKSNKLKQIDSREEMEKESRNISLIDGEDCKDHNHM